jgi:hypothetical protein
MVSDPLNFKNPQAKTRLETAKSRKKFAKKILSDNSKSMGTTGSKKAR